LFFVEIIWHKGIVTYFFTIPTNLVDFIIVVVYNLVMIRRDGKLGMVADRRGRNDHLAKRNDRLAKWNGGGRLSLSLSLSVLRF
jgi:hypothetical protein